jgi:hypothetical protein
MMASSRSSTIRSARELVRATGTSNEADTLSSLLRIRRQYEPRGLKIFYLACLVSSSGSLDRRGPYVALPAALAGLRDHRKNHLLECAGRRC